MDTYLYNVTFNQTQEELCQLEMRALFNQELNNGIILSEKNYDLEISVFLKEKIKLIGFSSTFEHLVDEIKDRELFFEEYKVIYLHLNKRNKDISTKEKKLCKIIGEGIVGEANIDNPMNLFALTCHNNIWYFGSYIINDLGWKKESRLPISYSNSLDFEIAKTVTNIATRGQKNITVHDPCCGVGTVVLAGLYSQYQITGSDINEKIIANAQKNNDFLKYNNIFFVKDINFITQKYDSVIVDVPYGLFSQIGEEELEAIVYSSKMMAKRQIFISSTNITGLLEKKDLNLIDKAQVKKRNNRVFTRYIWICENT